jgi:hypothetical protein
MSLFAQLWAKIDFMNLTPGVRFNKLTVELGESQPWLTFTQLKMKDALLLS